MRQRDWASSHQAQTATLQRRAKGAVRSLTVDGLRFFSGRVPSAGRMPRPAETSGHYATLAGPPTSRHTAQSGPPPMIDLAHRHAVCRARCAAARKGLPTPKRRNDLTQGPGGQLWAHQICFQLPECCTRIAVHPYMLILLGGKRMMTAD
jgi:hypothetical protein